MIYKVRVHSGERQYQCIKKNEDTFVIYVKEKAKEGRANEEVIRVFCEYLHISKNLVRIVRGMKSPHKHIEVKK